MDPIRMEQPQAMAVLTTPSAVAPQGDTKGGEGAGEQHHNQTATATVVPPAPKPAAVPYGHGGNKHGQQPLQPLMYHPLGGQPMSGEQQLPPQIHYNTGQGYMAYWPLPDMTPQGAPGHHDGGGGMPWCLMHPGGPQHQHHLLPADDALLKRRQRLDKNKESVRNYRRKKREEEAGYKMYVSQLEHKVEQYRRQIELMTQENVALKSRLELLGHALEEKNSLSSQ